MSNKKYFWLKLNDNFFEEDTIIWLEEQENGKDYVNFYLKLLLKSLRDEGKLVRFVGERVMPYDTKSLAKLTNTNPDTVAVAMKAFIEIGLVERLDTGELYFTQINEMIGSETESARRVRKHRALKNERTLQCNTDVIKCNTEIEKEIELDKKLDKELELDKNNMPNFETFWKAYPKKASKGQAEKTFNKVIKDKETLDLILADLEKRKDYENWQKQDGQFIPYPSTYLNNSGWLDEYYTEETAPRILPIL